MCLVAVDVGAVVEKVVLVTGLRRVICQRPIDEIVDLADESDVIIDCTVVIGRPQQRATSSASTVTTGPRLSRSSSESHR